jgi:hypothetical protein
MLRLTEYDVATAAPFASFAHAGTIELTSAPAAEYTSTPPSAASLSTAGLPSTVNANR